MSSAHILPSAHSRTASFPVRRPADRTIVQLPPLPSSLSTPWSPSQARLRRHQTNLALWTLQGWLAMFYIGAGYAKLTEPWRN